MRDESAMIGVPNFVLVLLLELVLDSSALEISET